NGYITVHYGYGCAYGLSAVSGAARQVVLNNAARAHGESATYVQDACTHRSGTGVRIILTHRAVQEHQLPIVNVQTASTVGSPVSIRNRRVLDGEFAVGANVEYPEHRIGKA